MPGTTELTVTSTERLSAGLVRLRFHSDDLSAFAHSPHTDRYVKLVFVDGDDTIVRTYTALQPDLDAGTLTIDFVVHGDAGVAGPWAAGAQPGDRISARGPGGAYTPSPDVDWHLIAGDESALPAIGQALAALPEDAVAEVVVEVPGPQHHVELLAPAGVTVTWVHHDGTGAESALVRAVRAVPWGEGRVQVFVHGEAEAVMHGVRPYVLKERAVDRSDASISGYWRLGRTEEGFREWKSALAATES